MKCFTLLLSAMLLLLMAVPVSAADVHAQHWTKLLINRSSASAGADLIASRGGEVLHDYDSFRLVRVPSPAVPSLVADAVAAKLSFELRDDFDKIHLPRLTVDTRQGKPGAADSRVAYGEGTRGLYVLQMIGPPTAEWVDQLSSAGALIVQGLQANGLLVVASPDVMARVTWFAFVQWTDAFQPFEKAAYFAPSDGGADVIVQVANVDGKEAVVEELIRSSPAQSRIELVGPDYLVHVHLNGATLSELLKNPLLVGVYREPNFKPSDERQSLSATSYINSGGASPTNPTQYNSWLLSVCPACDNLDSYGFRIGIADTGLDAGENASAQHADLGGGRQHFGLVYTTGTDTCPVPDALHKCDFYGHGTMVAAVAAGNAATNARDGSGSGWYLGMGVAPSAGIFSTKIFSAFGTPTGSIATWAHDARSQNVYIQNHSHNDYPASGSCQYWSGQYNETSRLYDYAVRDSNINWSDGITPITLTVSAGNIDESMSTPCTEDPAPHLVLPPATAKNVIAVGGAENYRPEKNAWNCNGTQANDFRNLNGNSKRGFITDGFYKPDLVAPASMITSAKSVAQRLYSSPYGFCGGNGNDVDGDTRYNMASGTSFAAPAAAGAALLASRIYSSFPGAASPALLKAMLIGTTRTMLGGIDPHSGGTPVRSRPNSQVGWGLLNLTTLLGSYPTRQYVNQSVTFTSSGSSWTQTYYPVDPNYPVTVVLSWSDAPAAAGSVYPLVNNLDLSVNDNASGGCVYQFVGNNIDSNTENSVYYGCSNAAMRDSLNNTEVVRFIPGYFTTSFTVTVRATSLSGQGVPLGAALSQDFALYVINGHV